MSSSSSVFTRASLARNSSLAYFPIGMPRSAGLVHLHEKMLGRPESLVAKARPAKVKYGFAASLVLDSNYYDFATVDLFRKDKTFDTANIILRTHMGPDLVEHFDVFENVPKLTFDSEDPEAAHFILELPPRSGLYSGYDGFFPALGFDPSAVTLGDARLGLSKSRSKTRLPALTKVYGIWNRSGKAVTLRSEDLGQGDSPFSNLGGLSVPKDIRLQVFMDNPAVATLSMANQYDLSQTQFLSSMDFLLQELKRDFGLTETPIDMAASSKDTVTMANKHILMKDNDATLRLVLNDSTSAALRMALKKTITFVFSRPSAYAIDTRGREEMDPLEGKYPVTLMSHGFGVSDCWVAGRGYMTTLGTVREGMPVLSDGALFETDNMMLMLELFDSTLTPLALDYDVDLYMMLRFSSV
jgi:hypothetical protein